MRLLWYVPVLVLAGACVKEDPAWPQRMPVAVHYTPQWNGAPFDKNTVYLTAANERALLQQVRFYTAPLTLVHADGEELLSNAELIDITNGATVRYLDVVKGGYDSLRIGLGLPYAINHGDISTIDPTTPLGNNAGMYWTWTTQYRFMIFEGRYDTDPVGTGIPPYPFSIHTGRDTCYRARTLALAPVGDVGDTLHIYLAVNLARFFTDGNVVLDLSQGPQSHGLLEEMPIALKVSDLAIRAFQVE